MKSLSHVRLSATPWTVAYHTPPSMGFSRQEYWSGLPFPSPEDLPDPGIESMSPAPAGFLGDASGNNPTANVGDITEANRSLGQEDSLEEGMATHSSILAWRIPKDRGAWWAAVHGVAKSQTQRSSRA